jgi:hypothetical protein
MTIRERIRTYFGVNDLATKALISAVMIEQRKRYDELLAKNNEVLELLTGTINALTLMNQRLTTQHVERPTMRMGPVTDWDTIQQRAAAEFEEDPKKGN